MKGAQKEEKKGEEKNDPGSTQFQKASQEYGTNLLS